MEHYITYSIDLFIFKPVQLLKLWDNVYDTRDILTFSDLNKFFLIKLYLFQDNYLSAYKEVKFLLDDIEHFDREKSYHAFIYYLGKSITGLINQINDNQKLSKDVKAMFDIKNLDFYSKITKVGLNINCYIKYHLGIKGI